MASDRGAGTPSPSPTATIAEIGTDQSSDLAYNGTPVPVEKASDASRRRDRIKLLLGSITEATEKLAGLIEVARDGDDHLVLGYASWTAYVAAEFAGLLSGLGAADRRIAVHALAASGMPTRAIAEVAGTSQSTAARDVRVSHRDSPDESAPADETVVLADGSEMVVSAVALEIADASDGDFEAALTAAREQNDLSAGNVVRLLAPRVIGRDGRSYAQQVPPRTPRRKPLPEAYAAAMHDITKMAEKLERLTADDRFSSTRDLLASRHGHTMQMVTELLAAVSVALVDGGDR